MEGGTIIIEKKKEGISNTQIFILFINYFSIIIVLARP
jgi:hypothetical protein